MPRISSVIMIQTDDFKWDREKLSVLPYNIATPFNLAQ